MPTSFMPWQAVPSAWKVLSWLFECLASHHSLLSLDVASPDISLEYPILWPTGNYQVLWPILILHRAFIILCYVDCLIGCLLPLWCKLFQRRNFVYLVVTMSRVQNNLFLLFTQKIFEKQINGNISRSKTQFLHSWVLQSHKVHNLLYSQGLWVVKELIFLNFNLKGPSHSPLQALFSC